MFQSSNSELLSFDRIGAACHEAGFSSQSLKYLDSPRLLTVIFKISIGIIVLLLVALLFAPWQQVSIGKGTVISYTAGNRGQTIEAPLLGRIQNWLVQEGQKVKKGTALAELVDFDSQLLERLDNQLEAARLRLQAAEHSVEVGRSNIERQRRLAEQGLSSRRDVELARIELSKFEAELSSAQTSLADLQVKISRQKSQSVKAPFDAVVVRILAPDGGAVVKAGEPLALLVPDTDDRAVELTIRGIDLPLVSAGRKVRLQFEGWPAVQFTGWPAVAIGTFGGVVKFVDAIDDGKGNYRVVIFPDPEDYPWPEDRFLRQGVRVVGWILLDEVTLGWELWRQLNGFPMMLRNQTFEETKDKNSSQELQD